MIVGTLSESTLSVGILGAQGSSYMDCDVFPRGQDVSMRGVPQGEVVGTDACSEWSFESTTRGPVLHPLPPSFLVSGDGGTLKNH